jgi:hypothetical protein
MNWKKPKMVFGKVAFAIGITGLMASFLYPGWNPTAGYYVATGLLNTSVGAYFWTEGELEK